MKLTTEILKKLILEEIIAIGEEDPATEMPAKEPEEVETPPESPAPDASPEKEADPIKSVSQLKKDLLDASKNIQNVKGLDPKEIQLISATLGIVLQLASQGSAATILQRIHNVLQKQVK
tara:strand:+ start:5184 stop:5543 length:360 start_codon:yes stop_codon:yes gene_type:complete